MAIGNRQSKEIWLGPLLGSNRARLIERCASLASEGQTDSFVYLAASHPLLEVVTEEILEGNSNRGLWGELPVYLFRGLVRRILLSAVNETGERLPSRIPIDRAELPLQRSLISQILARLKAQGKLKALAPLAHSEGCVNTIVKLIGELERAAKSPAELRSIIEERSSNPNSQTPASVPLQIDFDREVALIYEAYERALSQTSFTEEDADQLRALAILRGELEGQRISVPWLSRVKLLVLDGFFDFTPVQGEMLRLLITSVPEVVANLNHDERNREIFRAFQDTIEQLRSIDTFEVLSFSEPAPVKGALAELREKLFNPTVSADSKINGNASATALEIQDSILETQAEIQLFECTDRETEIRAVAKEIKRLVFSESYQLSDIALVVRERESYAETIDRVMREESIPCNLERRVETTEISAVRAARKLFQLLTELAEDETSSIRISTLADLIKSEYFRLADDELATLADDFGRSYASLLRLENNGSFAPVDREREEWLKREAGIGRWDVDGLENVIAYVGAELRVTKWLERAGQLLAQWPQVSATRKLVAPDPASDQEKDDDPEDNIVDADKIELDTKAKDLEKKRRPARDVHPAAIAWVSLVIRRLSDSIKNVPREGEPLELRLGILRLLEQLQFYSQIRNPLSAALDSDLPHAMLDLSGLEALRRGLVATIKSFEIAQTALPATGPSTVTLTSFLNEVSRCLVTQAQAGNSAQFGGLRVLAATDVRGLRFRAVFIAGLIEGGFPLRASRDWIYPHEERARLKEFGLSLEDISPATLLKEEHYFYQAACRATERLYLLRPLSLEDGTETVASYYIEELRRAIAPAALKISTMRRDFDGKEVLSASSPTELARSLVRQQEQGQLSGLQPTLLPAEYIEGLIEWATEEQYLSASALKRIAIERKRATGPFGPYDGLITDENLRAMLGNQFGISAVHSASGLSTYGNCPYRFFASRVLKLEPRGEAALDLQALDAGKLLHDVLRQFFERHRGERLRRGELPDLRRELAEMADRVFDEHQRVVPPLNPHIWKIDREIRKILLDQVLLFELGVQEKGKKDVRPAYFEVAFGMKPHQPADAISRTEHLELSRSGSEGNDTIKIQGQIDRVDVCEDPEGHTLIAYDYKLSNGYNSPDMVAGRTLQVPIYLEALERLLMPNYAIAGGGYYTVRGSTNRRNKGIYRADYSDYTGIQAKSSVWDDNDWQKIRAESIKKIWEFLDGMRGGSFVVSPSEGKKTCRFCDFAAVCRYERYRIERKKQSLPDQPS